MSWLAAILIVVLLVAFDSLFEVSKYKYDRNPFRRYCRKCGQQQDLFEQGHSRYWEDMFPIKDKGCRCHDH